jgi:dihydrofolate reductase
MRKVIVSLNVTLDGFMAGPHCELDWHFNCWNEEMAYSTAEQLGKADTILLGGVTYRGMSQYWTSNPLNLVGPREDLDFATMLNSYPKVVFSKTMLAVQWQNARLATKSIKEEVTTLKAGAGKDLMVYGSGKIVGALIQQGLVDEFRLWVHPVVIGRGKRVFDDLQHTLRMQLYHTETFASGVVTLFYKVVYG